MALEEVTGGVPQPAPVTQGPATEIISGVSGWAALHKIADSGVSRFEAEFVKATARASSGINRAAIQSALKGRNKQKALRLAVDSWNTQSQAWKASIAKELTNTVAKAATTVSKRVLTNPSAIQFDATNPLATKWSRSQAARLVGNVGDDQIKTLRNVISQGFEDQPITVTDKLTGKKKTIFRPLTPKQVESRVFKVVNEIKGDLGLQSRQQIALKRFEQDLIKKKVKPSMLKKRVATYRKKLLRQRARSIARTELMRATNMGQQLLWEEAVSQGHLNPAAFEKVWITTPDDRLCQYCLSKNGDRVGIFDTFNNPIKNTSAEPQPPLHPMCRCSTALVKKGKGVQKVKAPTRTTQTTGKLTKPKKAKAKKKTTAPLTPKQKDLAYTKAQAAKLATSKKATKKVTKKTAPAVTEPVTMPADVSKSLKVRMQKVSDNHGVDFNTALTANQRKALWQNRNKSADELYEVLHEADFSSPTRGSMYVIQSGDDVLLYKHHLSEAIKQHPQRVTASKAAIKKQITGERRAWPVSDDAIRRKGTAYPKEVEEHYDAFMDGLTSEQRKAITDYTELDFGSVNSLLQDRTTALTRAMPNAGDMDVLRGDSYVWDVTHRINSAMVKAPDPPPPDLVWRGIKSKQWETYKEGEVFQLDGFQSTSIKPDTAISFAGKNELTTVFEIRPTKGMFIQNASDYADEAEFLMPHAANYRVVGRKTISVEHIWNPSRLVFSTEKVQVIQVEMVP